MLKRIKEALEVLSVIAIAGAAAVLYWWVLMFATTKTG
jgi:hypothetical protein